MTHFILYGLAGTFACPFFIGFLLALLHLPFCELLPDDESDAFSGG